MNNNNIKLFEELNKYWDKSVHCQQCGRELKVRDSLRATVEVLHSCVAISLPFAFGSHGAIRPEELDSILKVRYTK